MSEPSYREFLELVRARAGDSFRAAGSYTATDWEVLYVREDVATDRLRDALPELMRRARESEPIIGRDVYEGIGETQATVELHEGAAIIHFPISETAGVVISLDRDVAQGLGEFVTRCTDVF